MSIQSNINQTLSLAGFLASQSGRAADVKAGRAYQGRQEQAVRGLQDIKSNLRREELTSRADPLTEEETAELESLGGPKTYNEEEFKNIQSRAEQYQKDIYDAKSAALNPRFKGLINPDLINQPELSATLSDISGKTSAGLDRFEKARAAEAEREATKLSEIEKAKRSAAEAQRAKAMEAEKSKEFARTILEGVYSPLTDPRKGGF